MDAFNYIEEMNDEALVIYLRTGNINIINDNGESLLHVAIKYENDFAFDLLIKSYINLNIKDVYGNTPLIYSILYNKIGYFKRLIRESANINIKNNKHETAIMIALDHNKLEMAKILFDAKADLSSKNDNDENIFFSLVRSHNLELLDKMLGDKEEYLYSYNHSKKSLLHQAVAIRDINIAKYLLDKGILANIEDNFSETPLFIAVRNEDIDMISLLIENGALLGKVNAFYESIYDVASKKILDYLSFKENSVKYSKYIKKFPLHCAVIYNDYSKVKQLLNKFNVNKKDDYNILPIEYAKKLNHLEIYKLLEQYIKHCN